MSRLKELVPSVSVKDNVSQLDVILEAIRYIASLQVALPGFIITILVASSFKNLNVYLIV